MLRVFALRYRPGDGPARRRACELVARLPEANWRLAIDRRGVLLHYAPSASDMEPVVLGDSRGLIAGACFRRADAGARSRRALDLDAFEMSDDGRRRLHGAYWGPCAIFLHDRASDRFNVWRDPAAGRPFYWVPASEGVTACFTHMSDYIRACAHSAMDEPHVGAFLAHPRLVAPATCVRGVREVMAGQQISIDRDLRVEVETLWRPSPPDRRRMLDNSADAAKALREAVWDAAAAWVCLEAPLAHRLSGGLDSSIVLSALCRANAGPVVCINEFPLGCPEGDERGMARLVAAHFGCPLIEAAADPHAVDYRALGEIEVNARPSLSDISFADGAVVDAARRAGAVILSSGQGGDQLFHRARTPGIAAEAVRDALPIRDIWRIAFDTARLARRPIWDVFASIWDDRVLRRREAPYEAAFARLSFASADARAAAIEAWRAHPWWDEIRRAGPARAARIVHVADLEYYNQHSMATTRLVSAPILASLPVLEAVLRIPPYVMTQGGKERALARLAFAAYLPPEVVSRTQKGSTTRYHNRVFEAQLPFIREMLIDGEMCRRGLVDKARLEQALSRDVLTSAPLKSALTAVFVAEMWIRRFLKAKAACGNSVQAPATQGKAPSS